jgi:Zn-dependent peptidase ImmA (M78 family)
MTTKVRINKTTWTIDEVTQEEMDKMFPRASGLCSFHDNRIYVRADLSKREKGITVAHELAHAVLASYKIVMPEKFEEHYIDAMEEVLYRVAKVFPEVYK